MFSNGQSSSFNALTSKPMRLVEVHVNWSNWTLEIICR